MAFDEFGGRDEYGSSVSEDKAPERVKCRFHSLDAFLISVRLTIDVGWMTAGAPRFQ